MQRISSEFVGFVRDTSIRALDRLTEHAKEVAAPLRPVLRAWGKLSDDQKNDLLDELIGAVQSPDEITPVVAAKKPRKKAASSKKKRQ